MDEFESSLLVHEALSQPKSSPINIRSSRRMKRKAMVTRSEVWNYFTKFINYEGAKKGRCDYCSKKYFCDRKKNGTRSTKYHMNLCNQNPNNINTAQALKEDVIPLDQSIEVLISFDRYLLWYHLLDPLE